MCSIAYRMLFIPLNKLFVKHQSPCLKGNSSGSMSRYKRIENQYSWWWNSNFISVIKYSYTHTFIKGINEHLQVLLTCKFCKKVKVIYGYNKST